MVMRMAMLADLNIVRRGESNDLAKDAVSCLNRELAAARVMHQGTRPARIAAKSETDDSLTATTSTNG